jgi:P pilus assembly chaperone PapD
MPYTMKYAGWCFVLLILLTDLSQAYAQGGLMIYPRRLVFGSNQRSMDVTLANSSSDSASYLLSWKNYRMTESGQFAEITEADSGQYFADPELRFYPREVTLAPGESQKVRVQRANNRQLPAGEYRSHLEFRSNKPMKTLEASSTDDTEGIQTKLNMHLAITIPVIIESGNISAQVTLQNERLLTRDDRSRLLQFDIVRTGNQSAFGDFILTHRDEDGKLTEVGLVKGVAVYTPIESRRYSIPLNLPEGHQLNSGTLLLEYIVQKRRKEVLASLEIPLIPLLSKLN